MKRSTFRSWTWASVLSIVLALFWLSASCSGGTDVGKGDGAVAEAGGGATADKSQADTKTPDPGSTPDQGTPDPGSSPDLANPDPGTAPDQANPDPGTSPDQANPDPGTAPDLGAPDQTNPDPGTAPDLGTPDQGKPDQRVSPDKAPVDRGSPDKPTCAGVGQRIKLGDAVRCCKGLKAGTVGVPPNCVTTGQIKVCVLCGDGKCDLKNGENSCNCPGDCKSASCKQSSDCGKQTCKQSGNDCVVSAPVCKSGKCGVSTNTTTNATCDSRNGVCRGAPRCVRDSDCGKPSCSGTGVCTQTTPRCKAGVCTKESIKQPNASCDSRTGQCRRLTPGCKTACDCRQGQACNKGRCINSKQPVYCCSKAGCPAGQACLNANGSKGTCPKPKCTKNSDCGKLTCRNSGANCIQVTPTCTSGACASRARTVTNAACDKATGTCKIKAPACRSNSDCKSTCKQSTPATCTQAPGVCSGGKCSSGRLVNYSNRICNAAKGTCDTKVCRQTSDCGKITCVQNGSLCVQYDPSCSSRSCRFNATSYAGGSCDKNSGRCLVRRCRTSSDCGKVACRNIGTTCVQSTPTCSRGICSANSRSYSNQICDTRSGRCAQRCTKTADCGKLACRQSGTTCVQTVPACTGNACKNTTRNIANAICNTSTGGCAAAKRCRTSSDCGKSTCKQSTPTLCTQTAPTCVSGLCRPGTPRNYSNQFCGSDGFCNSKRCRSSGDCGKASCRQTTSGCIRYSPSCSSSFCRVSTRNYGTGYNCNTTTGNCDVRRCRVDGDCGKTTCRNSGTSCIQTSPRCALGRCNSRSQTYRSSICGSNGQCVRRCRRALDCGRSRCRQSGRTCVLTRNTCTNGQCQTSTTNQANKRCFFSITCR